MDSFQAVPKKAIVKKNNNKNPLFQDAKVEQIKKYWIIIPHTRTPQFTRTVRKVNVQNSIRSFSVTQKLQGYIHSLSKRVKTNYKKSLEDMKNPLNHEQIW